MPDLKNFDVKLVGSNIRIYGDVVDSETQTQTLATFGPNGQSYNAWWASLPLDQQIDFVSLYAVPIMLQKLYESIGK